MHSVKSIVCTHINTPVVGISILLSYAIVSVFWSVFLYNSYHAAQHCVQLTPLARPQTWARFRNVVACRRPCRFMEVASGATDALRWAATAARAIFNTNKTKQSASYSRHLSIVLLPKITSYIPVIFQLYYCQAERFVFPSSFNCTTINQSASYSRHLSIVLLSSRALHIPVIFQLYYYQSERFVFPSSFN